MKQALYLTKKYVRSYPKRCIGLVWCISLFLFAFLVILWYNNSFHFSLEENNRIKYGSYAGILFDVDHDLVSENNDGLRSEGAGLVKGSWKINSSQEDIWVGSIDENASALIPLSLQSGKMPQKEGEVAIEKSVYDQLGLSQKVGETIVLPIPQEDGTTMEKEYLLTGIIDNFSAKLRTLDKETKQFSIPSVLLFDDGSLPSAYVHVFAKSAVSFSRVLNNQYWFLSESSYNISQKSIVSNIILFPMALFFVFTTILGVFTVGSYFFKQQEPYLTVLRCLGFSKKKSGKFLAFQGFLLWGTSLSFAVILSILVLLLVQYLSSFSEEKLYLRLNPEPVIAAGLLSGSILAVTFAVLLKRFYNRPPLRQAAYLSRKKRRSQTNLKRCWHQAYGMRYRLQNTTSLLLVFFCVAFSIMGSFLPLFDARGTTFQNPDNFADDTDYALYVPGGSSSAESYYINFPVDQGVLREEAAPILENEKVKIMDAYISNLCVPFFLTTHNPENRLLHRYAVEIPEEYTAQTGISRNPFFEHPRTEEMIKLAGGDPDIHALIDLPVKWQPYEVMVKNTKGLSSETLKEENYKKGIEIVGPDTLCSVGDTFTLVIPVADQQATEGNIEDHVKFEIAHVTVAATYPLVENQEPNLLISSEYLFSIYPDINYEYLTLQNLCPEDREWTEDLEENLINLQLNAKSDLHYSNYTEMAQEFYQEVNLQAAQIISCVLIFVIIILIAITCAGYVQIRSNLMSYSIMRAIGADVNTVQNLMLHEVAHTIKKGILSGVIVGFGVIIAFSVLYFNIKTWDIFLFYVLPLSLITIFLLYFGSRFAIKFAIRPLLDENLIQRINTIE